MEQELNDYILRYHANKLQLLPLIYRPRRLICLMGRGTGKTEEITVNRIYDFIHLMPGALIIVGCDSFKHLAETIMPAVFTSLKKKGLEKEINYWVNRFPPAGIARPIQVITDPDGFVFFDTGAALCYVSTNFQSHANGKSVDAIIWEEAKLLKWNRVKEANLMLRGNQQFFGNLWCHLSLTVISDMSDDPDHWTFKFDELMDKRVLRLIASFDYQQSLLQKEIDETGNRKKIDILQAKIDALEEKLNFWRRKAVLVLEGSSVQNLHALGYDVLSDYLSNPRNDVKLNVLSIRPEISNKYYYQYLSRDKHGIVCKDWDYIKTLKDKSILDCRIDTGDDVTSPIQVCMDYNNHLISLAYGQLRKINGEYKFRGLGEFFAEDSKQKIEACVRTFCNYHHPRSLKKVVFCYDNNADWTDAGRPETYKQMAVAEFERQGWEVEEAKFPILTQDERFTIWQKVTTNDNTAPFQVEFEEENCPSFFKAAKATLKKIVIKYVTDRKTKKKEPKPFIEKVKTSELDKKGKTMPIQEHPHITEAYDGLIVYNWTNMVSAKPFKMKIKQIN